MSNKIPLPMTERENIQEATAGNYEECWTTRSVRRQVGPIPLGPSKKTTPTVNKTTRIVYKDKTDKVFKEDLKRLNQCNCFKNTRFYTITAVVYL